MALDEIGRYTGNTVDEVGVRVFTGVDEVGLDVFGLTAAVAAAVAAAFQPDAFQEPEAFQTFAGIVALSQAYFGEFFDWWEPPEEAYWTVDQSQQTSLDITPVFFPPVVTGDEIGAAQDYNEDYQWTLLDEDWSASVFGFPDQALDPVPAFFPPDVTEEFFAQYPLQEQPWFPEQDTEDYANDSALDSVPAALFPPDVTDDFFARQPHYGELPIPPEETEDYANDTSLDVSPLTVPPDAFDLTIATQPLAEQPWFEAQDIDTELQNDTTLEVVGALFPADVTDDFQAALYPLGEQPWFPDSETEDYADVTNDDVTPQFFPVAAADDSYIATLDLPDQVEFDDPDWEYAPFLEQNEGFLSPNDAFDTTIATQPHYGELPIPPEESEDYANDSTVDTSWSMDFASGDEVTIATEPLAEFPEFPDDLSQFDTSYVEQNEGAFFPPAIAGDDLFAAQPDPSIGQDPGLNPEWDSTNDQPLVDGAVEAFQSPNDALDVTIATQYPLGEQPWVPDQDIDTELQNDSTIEVIGQITPPDIVVPELAVVLDLPHDIFWPVEDDNWDWWNHDDDHSYETNFPPNVQNIFFVNMQVLEQPWFEAQDIDTELQNDTTLDVTAAFFPPAVGVLEDIATQLDPSVGQDWLLWPDPDPTNDQPLVDGAPELVGAGAQIEDREGIWQMQNRYHVNKGHWDDASQGRTLRWPP